MLAETVHSVYVWEATEGLCLGNRPSFSLPGALSSTQGMASTKRPTQAKDSEAGANWMALQGP